MCHQDPIPERFRELIRAAREQQMEELDLSNGWLTQIPDELFELTYLKKLDLSNNRIKEISGSINNLAELEELNLSSNNLCNIPLSLLGLSNLTKLNLSFNEIKKLPDFLSGLLNLNELNLSFNKIKELPDFAPNLPNLTNLDLSFNQIKKLPCIPSRLPRLTKLNLSFNRINQLSESIFVIKSLKELNLGGNNLSKLPDSIGKINLLTKLYLHKNLLEELPDSLGDLINLTFLSLANNNLTKLPDSIGNLSHLKKLLLSNNDLTELPEFREGVSRYELKELYLHNNSFSDIPNSLDNFTDLTTLSLSNNQLTYLPVFLEKFTNLRALDLSNNKLIYLPDFISNLDNLSVFLLINCELTTLPGAIGDLSNLTELYLSDNQLTTLPEAIGNLSNLTELYLSDNQLTTLPEAIGNLFNLTELYLSDNQLTTLPEAIGNLSNLTELYLSDNQLTTLPEAIGNLSNLTELYLISNPLETPPIEVANKGIEAIQEYFRQLREEGKDYIYEAKLLIVGEAGAGKTTLAKKIEDQNYQLRDDEEKKEGVEVIRWSFPFLDKEQKKREFKVNIWDFGGQEIYHATHQFFLTKRSLYTLVVDNRREDDNLYYWLNSVELLSNNSPLLIIKNERQDRKRDINESALRGQFTNLKETLATNLKTSQGLDKILSQIQHYIQDLPHIGQALPKTWVQVRKSLENDKRNYISLQEYLDICKANGFTRHEDKLQLSGYLHDLGVCLHFQDQEDSLLYKTVILKPEWGTDAVYKVLDNPQVINNQGCFTRDDLQSIWHEDKYSYGRGELLELMKKFQLCYEIPGKKNTFIAPQLLSHNQPNSEWDESHNLILRYTYPDFMPKGIISRFIVIMHQYIHSNNDNKCVWKSGVVLEQDSTLAEIIEYYGKREITIRVRGNNKRNFMTIVTHELDKINHSYKRLKYQKLIPCNCETCKNSQNPYAYQFNELIERVANHKLTIECGKPPYHEVQILSLIDKSIDMQKLLSQLQKDKNKDINVQGNIQQLIFRYIAIQKGNYNEHIEQDYIEGNYTDQSRTQHIKSKAINTEGAAAFGLGDISGTVANTINQLPTFDNEPHKQELKELLTQLQTAVNETDLDDEDKQETLEQINSIAQSLHNPQDSAMKKASKKAMKGLGGTAFTLPSDSPMVAICKQVSDAIKQVF